MKIALASSDGKSVNKHFGDTPFFEIVELDSSGYQLIERRENAFAHTQTAREHNQDRFTATIELISDCSVVIAAKIGRAAQFELQRRNIQALEQAGAIGDLLTRYTAYLAKNIGVSSST